MIYHWKIIVFKKKLSLYSNEFEKYSLKNLIKILLKYKKILSIKINDYKKLDFLNTKNINLQNTLKELEKRLQEQKNNLNTITAGIEVELQQDVGIDLRYIKYIEKYGIPEDGFFDIILLNEF